MTGKRTVFLLVLFAAAALSAMEFLPQTSAGFEPENAPVYPGMSVSAVQRPDARFKFLHDTAVTVYRGSLWMAWYNCPEKECVGTSVIRARRSDDGGKNWSEVMTVAEDPDPRFQFVPPSFGTAEGNLYILAPRTRDPLTDGEKKGSQTLHLFRLGEDGRSWHPVRKFDNMFLPNTNVQKRGDGKLILAGRDVKRNQPAVMIFDGDSLERSPWRVVHMIPEGVAKDPPQLCPEASLTVEGMNLTSYVRCGMMIAFRVYTSGDGGETWRMFRHEIPVLKSKMNSGVLSDGRRYFIFNVRKYGRDRLFLALSGKDGKTYSEFYTLRNGDDPALDLKPQWSYPSSVEYDGKLYISVTCRDGSPAYGNITKSAAALLVLPLKRE